MSDTPSPWYKVLTRDNAPAHGGAPSFAWPLPTDDGPGAWTPTTRPVRCCSRGYHLTRKPMAWPLVGMRVYEAEGDGATDDEGDPDTKTAFARARLLRPADGVVPAYWRAVERFVAALPGVPWFAPDGQPDPAWLLTERPDWATARAAAGAAAGAAAWAAAWDAAGAAARAAARDAARDAAGDAAWAAARDAAWDAAWDAATDAATDAARDAELMAAVLVCDGLALAPAHVAHAEARWRVWQKGWALLGDVDGRLVVYAARPEGS